MTKLKPCPFCGGEAKLHGKSFFFVACNNDLCSASTNVTNARTESINAWNTRQPAFDWKPIEELEKLDFSEYLDLVFYNEESSSQFRVGSTDFDFKIYMYVGRTYYDKEELKERFTHFDILTPPERR